MAATRLSERWNSANSRVHRSSSVFGREFHAVEVSCESYSLLRLGRGEGSKNRNARGRTRAVTAKPGNRKREVKGALFLSFSACLALSLSLSRGVASTPGGRVQRDDLLHGDFWNVLEIDSTKK